jgi:flagellar motor switch protein FliM
LRRLRAKHDGLVTTLDSTLSLLLRKDFSLRIARLETIPHDKMIDTLPELTHLTLFRLDPLSGTGFLEVTPRLGLTVVTRMLGSNAYVVKVDRSFTEIESRLMNQFIEVVLREYASLWRPYEQQLSITVAGHENNPRFLKLASPEALMFFLVMEAKFGECTGFVRVAIPYGMLEPLINRMVTEMGPGISHHSGPVAASNSQIQQPILDVPIEISAQWKGLQLTVDELRHIRKDDVFVLDRNVAARTALYMGNVLKFIGQVGRKGDRLAVRITSTT